MHVAVTRSPTSVWTAQQLREATPFEQRPRLLIRDNDGKFGRQFDRVAKARGIEVLRTPVRAPKANAVCERYLGSLRRECLDHILILSERHMLGVLKEHVAHFNRGRPHQGIGQRVPAGSASPPDQRSKAYIVATPILGGLHHEYRWAESRNGRARLPAQAFIMNTDGRSQWMDQVASTGLMCPTSRLPVQLESQGQRSVFLRAS